MADWARKLNVQVYALRVQPLEVFRWFQIRSRCQHTSGLCCHSEGPLQAGEIRQMESSKAQQEKSCTVRTAVVLPRQQLHRKGPGCLGGQIECASPVYPHMREHPGLH